MSALRHRGERVEEEVKAPLVEVVDHRRENRSGRHSIPGIGVVYLCGVFVSIDRLACGHTVEVDGGGKAKRRRCQECASAQQPLPIGEP